jgi:hypothetical protein
VKNLCKRDSKELLGHARLLVGEGRRPKYVCTLCGRASRERGDLCKPLKIRRKNRRKHK